MDIASLINQLAVLFIIMFAGFGLNKVGLLGGELDGSLTKFVLQFTMPLMVLASVLTNEGERDMGRVLEVFVIAVITYVALPLLGILFSKICRIPMNHKGVYRYMFVFGNVGFMGFPIVEAIFGADSVLYAGIFNIVFNLASFSYGAYFVSKDGSIKAEFGIKTFLTPGIILSVLAIIIYFTGISFPDFIVSPIDSLGSMTTPLAMLLIGSTIANMDAKSLLKDASIYIFIIIRMFALPLLVYPILKFFIKDTFLLQFSLIMLMMPVANSAVLFAKQYEADEEYAAKGVFLSTLLSIIYIPLVSYICLR